MLSGDDAGREQQGPSRRSTLWRLAGGHPLPSGGAGDTLGGVVILVDSAIWPWRGRQWAHLISDASYEELHAFAALFGIPPQAFQGDHYDVPAELRERAVALGAQAVTGRELITRLRASGLRRPHRPRQQGAATSPGAAPDPG